jgi:plastocyanin
MRVTSRFALGALVLGTLCLIAEPAEGGPFRRRAARGGYSGGDCSCGGSYGMAYGGSGGYYQTGSGMYYGQIQTAGGYIQPGNIIPAGGFPSPMPGGGSPLPSDAASVEKIKMTDGTFSPATITVPVGTTVRWTNAGDHPHTVTSDKGTWGSNEIPVGGDFTATFTKPGTFDYHCKMHKDMKGTIIVK